MQYEHKLPLFMLWTTSAPTADIVIRSSTKRLATSVILYVSSLKNTFSLLISKEFGLIGKREPANGQKITPRGTRTHNLQISRTCVLEVFEIVSKDREMKTVNEADLARYHCASGATGVNT